MWDVEGMLSLRGSCALSGACWCAAELLLLLLLLAVLACPAAAALSWSYSWLEMGTTPAALHCSAPPQQPCSKREQHQAIRHPTSIHGVTKTPSTESARLVQEDRPDRCPSASDRHSMTCHDACCNDKCVLAHCGDDINLLAGSRAPLGAGSPGSQARASRPSHGRASPPCAPALLCQTSSS